MPTKRKKTFLIVDGHALLHRAWHALPPLTTKDGRVVHGAYGFTMILLGAIKQLRPEYVAVTFDLKGPTFRHEQYEAYKATREKKPDELYAQVPVIERILAAMGILVFTKQGFEADDVIGTLSLLAGKTKDVETVIVTGDLDTLQLVDDRTTVSTLRRGMTDTVLYDERAVRERFGLDPTQMIDYKALRGDPSDNIPGVKGIGEKTATELLQTFGTLDALYAALDKNDKKARQLKPAVREKLLAHRADAMQARDLCRIRRDVPLDFSLPSCAFAPATREQVAPVFEDLEFMKLLQQFPEGTPEKTATPSLFGEMEKKESAATVITNVRELDAALAALSRSHTIAFRTLTENDDEITPTFVAMGIASDKRAYIVTKRAFAAGSPLLSNFFANDSKKICHDLKRELALVAAFGIELSGPFFDLMIASYLLYAGERRHGLDAILANYRSVPPAEELDAEGRTARLGMELSHFLSLADEFGKELERQKLGKINAEIELPLAAVLARMERAGVAIDVPYFEKLSRSVGKRIDALTEKIHAAAGEEFNINSPQQLKAILFEKLNISSAGLKRTAKGKTLSTAASELEKLRGIHPIIDAILDYRELAKLKSTYIDALPALVHPKTGRIHANFNQTVTATGRLSSSNPNLQNIPTSETEYGKKVRDGFVAPKGWALLAADYSQFELRIAAHIAKEKSMLAAFRNGEDIHWRTAAEMWGEKEAASKRRIAKVINFGILYGMGPQRLSESAGISFAEARDYIDQYFALHKNIAAYVEAMKEKALKDGYVETLFGRRRFFRNLKFLNPRERAEAERQAINMPIQGTQADMIKIAMIRLDKHIDENYGADGAVKMIMQVHDELVFEVKTNALDAFAAEAKTIMEGVEALSVPIVVNVSSGPRWGDMERRA